MNQESAADRSWARRRMPRRLELTLRTDTGLSQGEALWMDGQELLLWTTERLEKDGRYLVRVDLGAMGESVDVHLTVTHGLSVRSRTGGSGYLHAGRYTVAQAADKLPLERTLQRMGGDDALYVDPVHVPVNYDYIWVK